jgi:hypothetical protein
VIADVVQHRGDPAVLRLGVEDHVELVQQRREPVGVTGLESRGAVPDDAGQRGQVLGRDVQRGLPRAQSLQQLPHLVDLAQVLAAVPRDDRAAVRGDLDEAVLLQPHECLTERGLAHPEPGGQLGLAEQVSRRQPGRHDLLPELQVHRVLQLAMLDTVEGRAGHNRLHGGTPPPGGVATGRRGPHY